MAIEITLENVRREMKRLVEERGRDFTYKIPVNGCLYVENDVDEGLVPSCAVGVVFHRLGIPLNELRLHEFERPAAVVENIKYDTELEIVEEELALDYLGRFQEWQDTSNPYGLCLDVAEERAANETD